MKYRDAQLISKFTTMKDGVLYYGNLPADDISINTWEEMLKEPWELGNEKETKEFFKIMIVRAKKLKDLKE